MQIIFTTSQNIYMVREHIALLVYVGDFSLVRNEILRESDVFTK